MVKWVIDAITHDHRYDFSDTYISPLLPLPTAFESTIGPYTFGLPAIFSFSAKKTCPREDSNLRLHGLDCHNVMI